MAEKKQNQNYVFAVGRRKTSVARVRLHKGKGDFIVNEKPIAQYFNGEVSEKLWTRPFQLTQTEGKYYVTAKIVGGGKSSQLGALIHGIARSLAELNREEYRPSLKKNGLLTRDPRQRERRKVGTGGKARRKKQSPKR